MTAMILVVHNGLLNCRSTSTEIKQGGPERQ